MTALLDSISLPWKIAGMVLCLSQSAMFSGLNLACFGVSRLRLEIESEQGNTRAARVLSLRRDSNFLLATILWGNVSVNVLLAMISDSLLTGFWAFLVSTVAITFGGEIIPQAYFSRHALRMAGLLTPVIRTYQLLLFPLARPTSFLLDAWLGEEGIQYFKERDLKHLLRKHLDSDETDLSRIETVGAANFLDLDDVPVRKEGEAIHPRSIIALPERDGAIEFPKFQHRADDPFLRRVQESGRKWVILTSPGGEPRLVLNAHAFLRAILFEPEPVDPARYCHQPEIVRDPNLRLDSVIDRFQVHATHPADDVVDHDLVLLWGEHRRIITGADILGRLFRGIARRGRPPR